ncbi:unnamed protein product [Cunninghamella blakesleeana]
MSNKEERLKTLFQVPVTKEIKGSKVYYEKVFYSICSELMLNYDLCIKSKKDNEVKRYDLLEVESYFKSEKYQHNDPYTHNHPIQYKNGLWYFHHMGQSSAFKGGSRKGVDITLGRIESTNNQEKQRVASGGILIRAIQCQKTQKLIEGPCLLVDHILKELDYSTLNDLVKNQFDKNEISGCCWDQKSGFFIAPKVAKTTGPTISSYFKKKPQDDLGQDQTHNDDGVNVEDTMDSHINTSCRVGLGLKNRSPSLEIRLDYVCRPYRYTKKTWLLTKGKVWTLLALLRDNQHKNKKNNSNHKIYSGKLNIKSALMTSIQSEFDYGINHAASVIKSCLIGKDIIEGSLGWKIKVMSAILWREDQLIKGKKVNLDV